ncbi:unnamed protein product [Thelazia callipaeda]|uniref:galactosylxylosylprotein 3-beta-galactosyltransferase n=1 Tax=Thelazia callipaeda TaxID=103827 RepID=A0A158RCV2_THECL|nr:unnamed protein product [Thelazia callipaeda]
MRKVALKEYDIEVISDWLIRKSLANIFQTTTNTMGGPSVTAVSRLKKDYAKLMKDPVPFVIAAPLHSNILEWHYVIRGAPQTPYEGYYYNRFIKWTFAYFAGGLYHGKLIFPPDFPFKPPSIFMITPSGRFQTNTRLCLSISDFHPDTWNPAWTVSTIITGLLSFMNDTAPTLGSVTSSDAEKRSLARKSREFNLKDRIFCELFSDLAKEIREELADEQSKLSDENTVDDATSLRRSGEEGDYATLTYNLVVLAGVVLIAFALDMKMTRRTLVSVRMLLILCGCAVCVICTITLLLSCSCDERDALNALPGFAPYSLLRPRSSKIVDLPSVYLIISIMSSPSDSAVRTVIRNTWLRSSSRAWVELAHASKFAGRRTFRHVFSIGTKNLSLLMKERLEEENNLFGDLIFLENLSDSYQNLAKKTLLTLQALHLMYKFQFLLKVDSDSFVRLKGLMKALKDIEHPRLYWGFLDGRAKPKRKGKWAEKDWVICDRYVPYQLGGGYVLSYKLVDFFVRNMDLLKLYRNEDVSVGAWLAGLSVRYVHDPRFDTEFRSRGCNNQYIITHSQTPESLVKFYTSLVNTGKLCEKEYRIRPSYVYDCAMHRLQGAHLEDSSLFYNGTCQAELILWQLIAPFSILLRNIAVPWIFVGFRFALSNGFWLKFSLDFLFIVLPIILSLTLFSDHISVILLLELVALLSLIVFSLCEYCFIAREKPTLYQIFSQVVDDQHSPTKFVTYMRTMVLIATATAILAVDFDVFPRRFAKTHTYGRSIMDVGTASFVYCFAVVDVFKNFPSRNKFSSAQRNIRKHLSAAVLLCLGFGRTLILHLLKYPQQIVEYGVHWNFFITLACLRTVVQLLGRRFHLLFGLVIISVYQYLLSEKDLQKWLLSESAPRDNLVAMNREGIFSLFGYLSLYYFASSIASFMSSTGIRLKSWFCKTFQLLVIAIFLFFAQKSSEIFLGPPSRRIANLPYVLEMLVFNTIFMASCLLVQLASIFGWAAQMPQFSVGIRVDFFPLIYQFHIDFADESPFERLKPCVLDSLNQYGMQFFLLTNILTGFINLIISTISVTDIYHSTAVIIVYMFTSCAAIHVYKRLRFIP